MQLWGIENALGMEEAKFMHNINQIQTFDSWVLHHGQHPTCMKFLFIFIHKPTQYYTISMGIPKTTCSNLMDLSCWQFSSGRIITIYFFRKYIKVVLMQEIITWELICPAHQWPKRVWTHKNLRWFTWDQRQRGQYSMLHHRKLEMLPLFTLQKLFYSINKFKSYAKWLCVNKQKHVRLEMHDCQ